MYGALVGYAKRLPLVRSVCCVLCTSISEVTEPQHKRIIVSQMLRVILYTYHLHPRLPRCMLILVVNLHCGLELFLVCRGETVEASDKRAIRRDPGQ